jgi:hypothetical protein
MNSQPSNLPRALALSLLVSTILADHADYTVAFNDLAVLAYLFN